MSPKAAKVKGWARPAPGSSRPARTASRAGKRIGGSLRERRVRHSRSGKGGASLGRVAFGGPARYRPRVLTPPAPVLPPALRTGDFDFALPEGLIAQQPARPRDAARLLVVRPEGVQDWVVLDLSSLFEPGDV